MKTVVPGSDRINIRRRFAGKFLLNLGLGLTSLPVASTAFAGFAYEVQGPERVQFKAIADQVTALLPMMIRDSIGSPVRIEFKDLSREGKSHASEGRKTVGYARTRFVVGDPRIVLDRSLLRPENAKQARETLIQP